MDALIITLFVSLVLAGAGLLLLVVTVARGTHDHDARLALLPLETAPPEAVDAAADQRPD